MGLKEKLQQMSINCTDAEIEDFEARLLKKFWDNYKEECMNEQVIIKNKVDALQIVIPNGTAEKEYRASFRIPKDLVDDFWMEGVDKIGLKYAIAEDNTCLIEGIPAEAGQFNLKLLYKHKGWIDGSPILERDFSFAVNPDPKSLWKNIPTAEDIEYYQPDSDCEYIKVESKKGNPQKDIVVASQRGRSHAHEGKARDDHFKVRYLEDSGWYIMAVADGAGSAMYSRKGSTLACEAAVKHCEQFFSEASNLHDFEEYIQTFAKEGGDVYKKLLGDYIYKLVGNAAFDGYKAINAEAVQHGNTPIKFYATTLLLAVCKQFDFGWFVTSFWVGDGAMCIYDKERRYMKLLGTPDEGEFAGQTRFLTMPEIFRDAASFYGRLRFSIEQDFTALMLMTDGVSDPMFETDANLNKIEKWDELYDKISKDVELIDNNSESQYQLLKWLDFWSQGNHDDRTIAILY